MILSLNKDKALLHHAFDIARLSGQIFKHLDFNRRVLNVS